MVVNLSAASSRRNDRYPLPSENSITDVAMGMTRDIPLVATRLLAENRELFDRYDRAAAEASFRFAVCLPLLLISLLVPIRLGLPWWGCIISVALGLLAVILLMIDASRKQVESNDAIFQAVFIGAARFPSVESALDGVQEERARKSKLAAKAEAHKRGESSAPS